MCGTAWPFPLLWRLPAHAECVGSGAPCLGRLPDPAAVLSGN